MAELISRSRYQVWKFPLQVDDLQTIRMPKGARILTAQVQHGSVCIWALCDTLEPEHEARSIAIHGTGHAVANGDLLYIGTVQLYGGALAFHVFEVRPEPGVLSDG